MDRAVSGIAPARTARWGGVGHGAGPDPVSAGATAAQAAIDGRENPGLLLVFAPCEADLAAILGAVADVAPGVPLAGCAADGQFATGLMRRDTVVVLAIGGDGLEVSLAPVDAHDPRDAGARAAACVGDVAHLPHRLLLLFADEAVDGHADLVRGAYSVVGAGVPIAGGISGPDGAVFHGRSVLRGAVLGVAIGSEGPIGIGYRHGLTPIGEPMLVTRVADGRILALDERPAADVLEERLGTLPWMGAHPKIHLGLQRRTGEWRVRVAAGDDRTTEDRSLHCPLPDGALVWVMDGDAEAATRAAEDACADALDGLGGAMPRALLAFDCIVRRALLESEAALEEVAVSYLDVGPVPLAGIHTVGEFARTHGITGLHHCTIVVVAIG